jgi:alkylation response protein AidB-like acyl-CoA dehydrogenase
MYNPIEETISVASVAGKHAGDVDSDARFPQEAIDAARNTGLLGLVSAEEIGGHGRGIGESVAVVRTLAHECSSTAMVVMMHYCGASVIERYGSEPFRRSIAAEGKLTTLAFSEAGSRSHFWVPVSTAETAGDGFKLNASKQLTTSAGKCDVYVWSSRPVSAEGLSTIWAVPADSKGLDIPKPFDGLGLRGNNSAPIVAKDLAVRPEDRLGEDGEGFDVMMGTVFPAFCLQSCAVSVGMMEGVFDRTIQHITNATYAYDGSRICDLPQVRGHVAKMRVKTDMAIGFLHDAVDAVESGREDAMLRVLEAKVVGAETSLEVTDLAMRVCGGAAFRKDLGIERFFRDSRASSVMAPVTDALYDFIGKAVCGMDLFS